METILGSDWLIVTFLLFWGVFKKTELLNKLKYFVSEYFFLFSEQYNKLKIQYKKML